MMLTVIAGGIVGSLADEAWIGSPLTWVVLYSCNLM